MYTETKNLVSAKADQVRKKKLKTLKIPIEFILNAWSLFKPWLISNIFTVYGCMNHLTVKTFGNILALFDIWYLNKDPDVNLHIKN